MPKVTKHKATPYIVIDFETGGLEMDKCALTEIAMVAFEGDSLEKIGEYETLIAPHQIYRGGNWHDAEYHEGAAKVTGLTKERCALEGKDIDEVVKEVQEFWINANVHKSKTGYKPVIVAHNAQFEDKCMQNLASGRFDLSKFFHGQTDFYGNFHLHYIDTLDLAKLLWAANSRQTAYKLGDVLDRAGIPIYDAHRAMNDVRPSTEFVQWIIKLLRAAELSGVLNQSKQEGEGVNSGRTFKFQFN